jgi:hypothetical protein
MKQVGWIGLSDAHECLIEPLGLASPLKNHEKPSPAALLPKGSLICEFSYESSGQILRLFDYRTESPWPAAFSLRIGPNGTVTLAVSQGDQTLRHRLTTDLRNGDSGVLISYVWDAPARSGVLSVYIPDRGKLFQADLIGPMPLTFRAAQALLRAPPPPSVVFSAISDRVEPAGPMPSISGAATVMTPKGTKALRDIRPGQMVVTQDGSLAQVRWTGAVDLPARGRYQPLRLRAPYFGAQRDILIAPDQHLQIAGSEVEYLFGEESVLAAARDLRDNTSVLAVGGLNLMRYYHLLLDRHEVIPVFGTPMESFDPGPLLNDPASLRHSVLRDLPRELLPRDTTLARPVLRGFEAVTLTSLRAA